MLPPDDDSDDAVREIAALNNLSFETAEKYYWSIGDTPLLAEDGRVVVHDESGKELARLVLPVDDD